MPNPINFILKHGKGGVRILKSPDGTTHLGNVIPQRGGKSYRAVGRGLEAKSFPTADEAQDYIIKQKTQYDQPERTQPGLGRTEQTPFEGPPQKPTIWQKIKKALGFGTLAAPLIALPDGEAKAGIGKLSTMLPPVATGEVQSSNPRNLRNGLITLMNASGIGVESQKFALRQFGPLIDFIDISLEDAIQIDRLGREIDSLESEGKYQDAYNLRTEMFRHLAPMALSISGTGGGKVVDFMAKKVEKKGVDAILREAKDLTPYDKHTKSIQNALKKQESFRRKIIKQYNSGDMSADDYNSYLRSTDKSIATLNQKLTPSVPITEMGEHLLSLPNKEAGMAFLSKARSQGLINDADLRQGHELLRISEEKIDKQLGSLSSYDRALLQQKAKEEYEIQTKPFGHPKTAAPVSDQKSVKKLNPLQQRQQTIKIKRKGDVIEFRSGKDLISKELDRPDNFTLFPEDN